jgi:two-component system response regulator GlrR
MARAADERTLDARERELVATEKIMRKMTENQPRIRERALGMARVLVVDDDPGLLRLMQLRLEAAGYGVTVADSGERALAQLAVSRPRVVVTDLQMGGMDGIALFEAIRAENPALPVIILTAHGTIPDAVAAVKGGVFGYLTKPFDARALLDEIERALAVSGQGGLPGADDGAWRKGIITRNPAMEELLAKARLVAAGDAAVLIRGESGTGKELLARAVHAASPRRDGPFVAINCGAIPEPLLESELFGHVKGAFTGAVRDNPGLFRAADGGTLFLDEIGDMPPALQVKLLRVLQEKQVRPVGGMQHAPIDVRVISATHRDLEAEMAAGNFREDLYYRLKVVALALPPLAERREDIPLLAGHFLGELAAHYRKNVSGFAPDAVELLVAASWPGNVRQLHNVVEQSVALATTPLIPASLVQQAIHHEETELAPFEQARRKFERDYLAQLLKITEGNVTQAARLAKRNRTEFYKLLQRHRLEPQLFKPARA